jgi:hypothetical protein
MSVELAKRAIACKHWRWMAGMRTQGGDRAQGVKNANCWEVSYFYDMDLGGHSSFDGARELPDFSDPATLGCLLALVRGAWDDPSLCANDAGAYDLMFWHVYTGDKFVSVGCQTEAEALVAALEAAP